MRNLLSMAIYIFTSFFALLLAVFPTLQVIADPPAADTNVPVNGFSYIPPLDQTGRITASSVSSAKIRLHGCIKNQEGLFVPSSISVVNEDNKLADIQAEDGIFDISVSDGKRLAINVTPLLSDPQNYIETKSGERLSKYFDISDTIVPDRDDIDMNIIVPSISALMLEAFNPEGNRMYCNEINNQVSPPGYPWSYGVFPISDIDIPIPTGPSIGQLKSAWHPEKEPGDWDVFFALPPNEPVFLTMLWTVPDMGTIMLRADNGGKGFKLDTGRVASVNLVYEFAETEIRRTLELFENYTNNGYVLSPQISNFLNEATDLFLQARDAGDPRSCALIAYDVLDRSIQAREIMTMEAAENGIQTRKEKFNVIVQDQAGEPIPGASVSYCQTDLDFILGGGFGSPYGPFPYPTMKANKELGLINLYDQISWSDVSPGKGVYEFSEYDARLKWWQDMGFESSLGLVWLGEGNVPDWALDLEFSEFKIQLADFVTKTVEHFNGKVKYINLVVEPDLQIPTGSRYLDIDVLPGYTDGVTTGQMVDLVETVFDSAGKVDSDILLGYSGTSSYISTQLNPQPMAGQTAPYQTIKAVIERGVKPDYMGIKIFNGTMDGVPLDLGTISEIIQNYHDLTGLPVILTENGGFSSITDDYQLEQTAPDVHWHDGFTQKNQAEWDTSILKIAMGFPFVTGVQTMRQWPDVIVGEIGSQEKFGNKNGSDCLNHDFKPKQVYYAVRDLINSWKVQGAVSADSTGKTSFLGLKGTYNIKITTPEGLTQEFKACFNSKSKTITYRFDREKALNEVLTLADRAQMIVHWSQRQERELDFDSLQNELNMINDSINLRRYEGASSLAQKIIDTVELKIDGNPDDWKGIQPVLTAPKGGFSIDAANREPVTINTTGTDLKDLYLAMDNDFLYVMIDVYNPPIKIQSDDIDGTYYPQFLFHLRTDKNENYDIRTYLPYTGMVVVSNENDSAFPPILFTTGCNNILEFKVPLELLNNPGLIFGTVSVTVAKDRKDLPITASANEFSVQALYSLTTDVSGRGTVSPSGTSDYQEQSPIRIAASPEPGWEFSHWSGDTGTIADISSSNTTINIDRQYAVRAYFIRAPRPEMTSSTTSALSIIPTSTVYMTTTTTIYGESSGFNRLPIIFSIAGAGIVALIVLFIYRGRKK